jgi:hypothetical protein
MSKSIHHELVYPGASVDEVAAMLGDPAFRKAVAEYQGTLRNDVSVEPRGSGRKVVVDLVHGTDRVPSFARKFVGDEINIVSEEDWSSDTEADVFVTIPGKPGEMKGTSRLDEVGDGVVHTYDLAVKVGIPLVGGKIEDLIAGLLVKAYQAENKVGVTWLAGEWTP